MPEVFSPKFPIGLMDFRNNPTRAKLIYEIADFSFEELERSDAWEVQFMEMFNVSSCKFLGCSSCFSSPKSL